MPEQQTIEQYFKDHEKSGKADPATMMAAMGAIATAGRAWDELPSAEKTTDKAREVAMASLEPIKNGREADTKDLLFDYAGTRTLIQHYTQDLITRAEALDFEQGLEKGTHLKGFLDEVAVAVEHVNFDEFKKGNLKNVDLPAIRNKTSQAALTHIGMRGDIDQDIIATIKNDLEHKDDPSHKRIFEGVTIEPENLSFGDKTRVVSLMATYAAALNPKADEKAKDKREEQKSETNNGGPDPRTVKGKAEEFSMRSMDDIMAYVDGMPKSTDAPAAPLLTAAGSNLSQGGKLRQQETSRE